MPTIHPVCELLVRSGPLWAVAGVYPTRGRAVRDARTRLKLRHGEYIVDDATPETPGSSSGEVAVASSRPQVTEDFQCTAPVR